MSNVKFYMGDDDSTPLNFSKNQKINSNSKNLIQNQPQDTIILRKRPLRDNRKENNCYEIFQNLFKVFVAYLTIYIYG